MTHDPIQTLRWSSRPWTEDGHYVVIVRGRDTHGEAYGRDLLIDPGDYPFFWGIIDALQNHILRKIS